MNFKAWLMETGAIYDGTKPKDGDGFNWWGAVGDPLGVSIKGEPIKPKGKKRGRKKRKKR